MSLDGALAVSTGGLANINRQIALLSQNVANAQTPDYAVEVSTPTSVTAGSQGLGVRIGLATRVVNQALQSQAQQQNAVVAELQTRQTALQAIDQVHGQPGDGTDLSSLLGDLQNQFSVLLNQPDNQTQQRQVVTAATTLTRGINALSDAYTQQRQAAQDDLRSAVNTLNQTLATIGSLSDQIIALRVGGQGTADLENQRAAAVHALSNLLTVQTIEQPSGEMVITTPSGLVLSTRGSTPFAAPDATMQPGAYYPGGAVPGVTLNGRDVTPQLLGGRIGADLALRDTTMPTYQAELDEFAQGLASRFDAQGLTLFTDPTGAVPAASAPPTAVQAGYVGFAAAVTVNPAVAADPSLVRDGTVAISGSPTSASAFTPNPAGGPAGFTGMISRVLDFALGDEAQTGVPQPALSTTGLGATGGLNAPFGPPASLADMAATLVAAQSQDSADTSNRLGTEQGVQTALTGRINQVSGVNMDTEMSTLIALQTAYGANARVISAVQTLFNQLLNAVQ